MLGASLHQNQCDSDRVLRGAAVVFAIGFAFHTADHLRRGLGSVTTELTWTGTANSVMSVAIIAMVLFGDARAPQVSTLIGAALALVFASSHLLPLWSVFSDSFIRGDVALVSWIAAGRRLRRGEGAHGSADLIEEGDGGQIDGQQRATLPAVQALSVGAQQPGEARHGDCQHSCQDHERGRLDGSCRDER